MNKSLDLDINENDFIPYSNCLLSQERLTNGKSEQNLAQDNPVIDNSLKMKVENIPKYCILTNNNLMLKFLHQII